jgi:hypothetical protein
MRRPAEPAGAAELADLPAGGYWVVLTHPQIADAPTQIHFCLGDEAHAGLCAPADATTGEAETGTTDETTTSGTTTDETTTDATTTGGVETTTATSRPATRPPTSSARPPTRAPTSTLRRATPAAAAVPPPHHHRTAGVGWFVLLGLRPRRAARAARVAAPSGLSPASATT